jgi:hypothetical protein
MIASILRTPPRPPKLLPRRLPTPVQVEGDLDCRTRTVEVVWANYALNVIRQLSIAKHNYYFFLVFRDLDPPVTSRS